MCIYKRFNHSLSLVFSWILQINFPSDPDFRFYFVRYFLTCFPSTFSLPLPEVSQWFPWYKSFLLFLLYVFVHYLLVRLRFFLSVYLPMSCVPSWMRCCTCITSVLLCVPFRRKLKDLRQLSESTHDHETNTDCVLKAIARSFTLP